MNDPLTSCDRVHFVGISGIGMSALARLLLSKGYEVSGSDRSPGEQARALSDLGARVLSGHRGENINGAELVIVSSAVKSDNPEIQAAHDRQIPVIKRAELLASIMNAGRGIAVAGTHGKTTTSALVAHIMTEAGLDPTVLIGGISANLASNARTGRGDLVVVEADEYDASFSCLRPSIGVITNIEPEHLDFYGTEERMQASFGEFAHSVSDLLVICADDPVVMSLARDVSVPVVTYGIEAGKWRATDIRENGQTTRFVAANGSVQQEIVTQLAGMHNVQNTLAAIAVARALEVPILDIAASVTTFGGVARRFELKGEVVGVCVMDDYAVHPTEVRVTLRAMKDRYQRPLRVVFQPHTYSRTRDLLTEFAGSFGDADRVYILDIYASRETDTLGVSGRDLAKAVQEVHANAVYTGTGEHTVDTVLGDVQPGDLVVTMGAGDVYQLGPTILERLST